MAEETTALADYSIELDGVDYTIEYSLYSFAKLQKVFGVNALAGELDFNNPEHLLYFLWAGLITHNEEFDGNLMPDGAQDAVLRKAIRTLGSYLTLERMNKISGLLVGAFNASAGTSAGKKQGKSRKATKATKKVGTS